MAEYIVSTSPFFNIYYPDYDLVEIPLNPERNIYEIQKLKARISQFENNHTFPHIPQDLSFDRNNMEFMFSIEDLITGEYLSMLKAKENSKKLSDLVIENNSQPFIIASKFGFLGTRNLMVIHPGYSQSTLTMASVEIANTVAENGFLVSLNGAGNNNSKSELHIQIYDMQDTHIKVYKDMIKGDIVTLSEAVEKYNRLIKEGRLISIFFLGNKKVLFVEQKVPDMKWVNKVKHPYEIDIANLPDNIRRFFYLKMWLGFGCLEVITNIVIPKIPTLTIQEHKILYRKLTSKELSLEDIESGELKGFLDRVNFNEII